MPEIISGDRKQESGNNIYYNLPRALQTTFIGQRLGDVSLEKEDDSEDELPELTEELDDDCLE